MTAQNAYNDRPVTVVLNRFLPSTGHAMRGLQMNDAMVMERS
jgi:hypothetical protein